MKPDSIRDLAVFLREGSAHRHEEEAAADALELLLPIVEALRDFDDGGDEHKRTDMICDLIERAVWALDVLA